MNNAATAEAPGDKQQADARKPAVPQNQEQKVTHDKVGELARVCIIILWGSKIIAEPLYAYQRGIVRVYYTLAANFLKKKFFFFAAYGGVQTRASEDVQQRTAAQSGQSGTGKVSSRGSSSSSILRSWTHLYFHEIEIF